MLYIAIVLFYVFNILLLAICRNALYPDSSTRVKKIAEHNGDKKQTC